MGALEVWLGLLISVRVFSSCSNEICRLVFLEIFYKKFFLLFILIWDILSPLIAGSFYVVDQL